MKKAAVNALFFVFLTLFFQSPASADVVEGRVAAGDSEAISLVVHDAQGRPYPNQLTLQLDRGTEFVNVRGLGGLRQNDAVRVDARQTENGAWRAASIEKFEEVSIKPATKKTPPTMRDVLGNPVARGALTGAATGAIASSVSGGKAGKGALVGAGVGAGVGLLESLFSGGGQRQEAPEDDSY